MSQMENRPTATPARISQGTAIEQSRAVAEVQAAVVVAQQVPRSIQNALRLMRESCDQMSLAQRASYRFPRGKETVSGPSVYLARELARVWGNVQHGLVELERDDARGESQMQAWAWDVEANVRVSNTFIVPHVRDRKAEHGGPVRLVDLRDVYENNTNQASRRVREAIFNVLPPWFVEEAKSRCAATLKNGGGVPLPVRVQDAIKAFGLLGVRVGQIEEKLGRFSTDWDEYDVAQLTVVYQSLQRGEVTIADEFPPVRTTAEDIIGGTVDAPAPPAESVDAAAGVAQSGPPPRSDTSGSADIALAEDSPSPAAEGPQTGDDEHGPDRDDQPATRAQVTMLQSQFTKLGYRADEREERLRVAGRIVGIDVPSFTDLRKSEASHLIETLNSCKDRPAVGSLLEAIARGEGGA